MYSQNGQTNVRGSGAFNRALAFVSAATALWISTSPLLAQSRSPDAVPFDPSIDDIIKFRGGTDHRVIGGQFAPPGSWPSMIAIYMQRKGERQMNFCGGTVIGREWVLTAAHCAAAMLREDKLTSFWIKEGTSDLSSSTGRTVKVTGIYPHPDYNPKLTLNDVALLRLGEPTSTVRQKLVRKQDVPTMLRPAAKATVVGFGRTAESGPASSRLKQVDVPIVAKTECQGVYGSDSITDAAFCAGEKSGGKDSCQGDSGGPLLMPEAKGEQVQTGVVSWGKGCARPGLYGVYASVGYFEDWIRSRVRDVVFIAPAGPSEQTAVDQSLQNLTSGATDTAKPSTLAQLAVDIVQGRDLKIGSFVDLMVTSSVAGIVVVFNETSDGKYYQLYPSKTFPAPGDPKIARIEAGKTLTVPSQGQRAQGYRFAARPPEGANKLRVIVVPATPKMDELVARNWSGDPIHDFNDLIAKIVESEFSSRGLEPAKVDPTDRAIAELSYQIVR